jgi:parvulin-like peptidyl-prolyl isomerase
VRLSTGTLYALLELYLGFTGREPDVAHFAPVGGPLDAEAIRERATTGGESFEKLAADASDAPSKANAGLIGPISMSDLSADLRKMVEALKAGDVTPVTRMARGYQLYKLEALTTAQTMPFEQARDQIGDRVFTDKRKAEYQKYLEKLRAQAIIEWKNPDVKKAFEAGLKAQATVPSP